MKPLNAKQRRNAFIKFLMLFILSTAIIVGAIYFDFQVPARENTFLRNKISQSQLLEKQEQHFAQQMEKVKGLIDSLDMKDINYGYMDQLITTELAIMQSSISEEDSTFRSDMCSNIIQTYLELKNAKTDLLDLQDAKEELEEYGEIIDEYKEELDQAKRDLDICRQLNGR
ncbi:hypothetical protein DMA11_01915 [Marinilabiliaceae bacterium JC017]|nr:hypothetical protein DMA11_01915 [Marinilabiliaceae bacterium JC017]